METYYKLLHFLYDAQQRGLIDPDSKDQDWNAVYPKITAGQVHVSVSLPSDTNDVAIYRNACGEVLEEYSWKMIFCGSDDKFDALWDEMVEQMIGNGYKELAQFDLEKWQIELDAKNKAAGK